ncbi:uncharacterized protein LOC105182833 isoform X2 [Harpegnathos saltator]|uniref:uncharacterized protein LOC105182833 isoform X2 n=1 Tax=Harpegnathos saltator TaxID=610380 RepID=UPI000948BF16|nr:uncharacterized protein LOC105182833 isoform X2 [Harpegnathos saltator]
MDDVTHSRLHNIDTSPNSQTLSLISLGRDETLTRQIVPKLCGVVGQIEEEESAKKSPSEMLNVKHLNEDKLPFISDESQAETKVKFPYVHIRRPISKGVANHLSRWPNELSSLFVVACLIMSLILVTFVTLVMMIICSPAAKYKCDLGSFVDERAFNVYFVKETTQTWSREEFCYIETAARKYPALNIYLVNLIRTSGVRLNTPEVHLRTALITHNANICDGDFSIDELFSRSKLSNIAGGFSNELLLLAAKAYLLWNSPGIAMHPSAYCNLATINRPLCNREGVQDCVTPNISVAIDLTLDLQATEVHCQAFLGFLLQELSKNVTRIYSMKDALDKFCLRIDKCPEVRMLDLRSACSVNDLNCPTVYAADNAM